MTKPPSHRYALAIILAQAIEAECRAPDGPGVDAFVGGDATHLDDLVASTTNDQLEGIAGTIAVLVSDSREGTPLFRAASAVATRR